MHRLRYECKTGTQIFKFELKLINYLGLVPMHS